MKKKIYVFIAICLIALTYIAWAGEKIEIVTTLPDFKNFAEIIGGNQVHVFSIARGYQDPHHVEIKPSDIIKIKNADMVIMNGLDLDTWIFPLITNSRNPKVQPGSTGLIDASEGITVLEIPKVKIDRSLGDVHAFGNPHYTLSPSNMKGVFKHILKTMSENYPAQASLFQKNGNAYLQKLDQKIAQWKMLTRGLPNRRIVSFHNSWTYFFNEFGFESGGYMEPRPGISPSPKHTAELIEQMKIEKTKLIFKEIYFPDNTPEFVAEKTNAKVITVPTSSEANADATDYISLIDFLVKQVVDNQ